MKTKIILGLVAVLLFVPLAYAISSPTVDSHTLHANGKLATLKIRTEKGAKITVVGGSSDLAPMKDGEGKEKLDGLIDFLVGVSPGQKNNYSVMAQMNDVNSEAFIYVIDLSPPPPPAADKSTDTQKKTIAASTGKNSNASAVDPISSMAVPGGSDPGGRKGDLIPPSPPVIDDYPSVYDQDKITLTGSVESLANIFVRTPEGDLAGSAQARENGLFSVEVKLEIGKTNRLNISAEDMAGNEGPANQMVIRFPAPEPEVKKPEEKRYKNPFQDVEEHWARFYIQELHQRGVVGGKNQDSFDPNGAMTRAELTKVALNAFGYTVDPSKTQTPFHDVAQNDWFAPYVYLAYHEGLVAGFGELFKPNEPITRSAALKILLEAARLEVGQETIVFKDTEPNAWYLRYLAYAKKNAIIGGYKDGSFRPAAPITRAEVAKIVHQILELQP